jgi:DNA polymerase-3 subunit chi
MTSIDFYFNADDRMRLACRLAGKAIAQGRRLLVWAPLADSAQAIDRMLWTTPATGFVPHCMAHDALRETPVLISAAAPRTAATSCSTSASSVRLRSALRSVLEIVSRADDDRERAALPLPRTRHRSPTTTSPRA